MSHRSKHGGSFFQTHISILCFLFIIKRKPVQIIPIKMNIKPIGIKKNGSCNVPSAATREPIKLKVKKLKTPKKIGNKGNVYFFI